MKPNYATKGPSAATRMSPLKRAGGLSLLLLVMLVSGGLTVWLLPSRRTGPVFGGAPVMPGFLGSALLIAGGLLSIMLGAAMYGITVATNAFTFRFHKPFLPGIGMRMWLCNLMANIGFQFGITFLCLPGMLRLTDLLLPPIAALPVAFFAPVVVLQFVFASMTPLAPVERRVITRRLTALGCPPAQFPGGLFVGTSDASRSSFKRFPIVEQDMGMLWLMPGRLIYRGDRESFDLSPDQITEIQRKADGGSTASYFGAVYVILHVAMPDGSIRKIRLHPEGLWTSVAKARALDDIADRLWAWKAAATAAAMVANT